jgi:hypothetical protein
MTKTKKIILGGIAGMMLTSFISSTYFYTFFRRAMRKLDNGFKEWDFNF